MDGPLPLAVVFFAVLGLIGLTRALGFVARPVLSGPDEAHGLAQSISGGFIPVQTIVATDGGGALLRDGAGRIAIIAPIGAHFLVRLNDGSWIVRQAPDGQVAISGTDFACRLALGSAAQQWVNAVDGIGSPAT